MNAGAFNRGTELVEIRVVLCAASSGVVTSVVHLALRGQEQLNAGE